MATQERRKTIFVNREVQGRLVYRVVLYWFACIFAIVGLLAAVPIAVSCFYGANVHLGSLLFQVWVKFWPAFFASMLVLPIVILDTIRLSHRFVGPLLRIRNDMNRLADGEDVPPVELRENDAWADLAKAFNKVSAELQALRDERATSLRSQSEPVTPQEEIRTAS